MRTGMLSDLPAMGTSKMPSLPPEGRKKLGVLLTAPQVVARVAEFTSPADVEEARRRGRILGCRVEEGEYLYPEFQFVDGCVVEGLTDTLAALRPRLEDWQAALWFCTPNHWLGHWTPAAVLQVGGDAHVVSGFARRAVPAEEPTVQP